MGEQLRNLLQTHTDAGKQVLLTELDELFIDELGFHLRPEMCDAKSIEDLVLNKLSSFIKVKQRSYLLFYLLYIYTSFSNTI